MKSLSKLQGRQVEILDFLQSGTKVIAKMSRLIKNPFWSNVLNSVKPIMQGALESCPEKIICAPFWDNTNILRNNRTIDKTNFPVLASKVLSVADLYNPGTTKVLTKHEWKDKFNIDVKEEDIVEIRLILKNSLNALGLNENVVMAPCLPYRPLLIEIANSSSKGCSYYCKLLKNKVNNQDAMNSREEKWHNELNYVLGVQFWNRTYKLTASIKFENKIKWLQYQICRNSLYTNFKVHKFHHHVSPLCSYCMNSDELVGHLFFKCVKVTQFWTEIGNWLATLNFNFQATEKTVLFGLHVEESTSVLNLIILYAKHFIWISKFERAQLSTEIFQKYLLKKLQRMRDAFTESEQLYKFECWITIYDHLSRLPSLCTARNEALLPDT